MMMLALLSSLLLLLLLMLLLVPSTAVGVAVDAVLVVADCYQVLFLLFILIAFQCAVTVVIAVRA